MSFLKTLFYYSHSFSHENVQHVLGTKQIIMHVRQVSVLLLHTSDEEKSPTIKQGYQNLQKLY